MNPEIEEKTRRLVAMLDRENLDAVLLNAQHNFAWFTGGGSNGVDLSRENGVAWLLVSRDGQRYVLASTIEIGRMLEEELPEGAFDPIDYAWQTEKFSALLVVQKALEVLPTGARIGCDVTVGDAVSVLDGKIAQCRYQLTSGEVDRIRLLGTDAAAGMKRAVQTLSPGQTETEIAENLRHELARGGMTSVVTLVAADERIAQFRHPIPSGKSWQNTVLIVTCAKRSGLIASLSRLVCLGAIPDELKHRTEACARVHANILDATRPGAVASEIYSAAAKAYAREGFADEINLHHQGGAAGYKTREWVAHPQSSEIVRENQAFAWNPSITGTKVEDTYLVTDAGAELITLADDEPRIMTEIKGRHYSSPGIITI